VPAQKQSLQAIRGRSEASAWLSVNDYHEHFGESVAVYGRTGIAGDFRNDLLGIAATAAAVQAQAEMPTERIQVGVAFRYCRLDILIGDLFADTNVHVSARSI